MEGQIQELRRAVCISKKSSVSSDKSGILASFGKRDSFSLSIWNIQWGNWVSSVAGFRDPNNNIILYVFSILSSLPCLNLSYIYVLTFFFFSSFKWSTLSRKKPGKPNRKRNFFNSTQNGLVFMSITWANPDTKVIRALRSGKPQSCATSVARSGRYTLTYRDTRVLSLGYRGGWFLWRHEKFFLLQLSKLFEW